MRAQTRDRSIEGRVGGVDVRERGVVDRERAPGPERDTGRRRERRARVADQSATLGRGRPAGGDERPAGLVEPVAVLADGERVGGGDPWDEDRECDREEERAG